uniref:Uncharacterized protein n=1 Tax=Myotis lucifugus TaxID=59463 RepID=G1QC27_MYOLU
DVPAVLPMVLECKAPKEGGSVTLACLVTGSNTATWDIGAEKLPAKASVMGHFEKMGHLGETVPYLFYQTFVWKPVPYSCSTKHMSKTFQWPASWKTRKDEAELTTSVTHTSPFSEKLTPNTTTTGGP